MHFVSYTVALSAISHAAELSRAELIATLTQLHSVSHTAALAALSHAAALSRAELIATAVLSAAIHCHI